MNEEEQRGKFLRVGNNGRIIVPPDLIEKIGAKPGDIVFVDLHKVKVKKEDKK